MICDFELLILLLSNFCIVSLIFGLILETVFIVQTGFGILPVCIIAIYAVFMAEHLILFVAATKKNFKLVLVFVILRGLSMVSLLVCLIAFGAIKKEPGDKGKKLYGTPASSVPAIGCWIYTPVLAVAIAVFGVAVKYLFILKKRAAGKSDA